MAVLGRFGADTARGLCHRTAMDKVTVRRATTSLLSKQYLNRKTDPDDRRRTIFELTPGGRRIHDKIVPLARTREAELLSDLSPAERSQLDQILEKPMVSSA
jgi:DNA-binding MarR family transcriptional regulator